MFPLIFHSLPLSVNLFTTQHTHFKHFKLLLNNIKYIYKTVNQKVCFSSHTISYSSCNGITFFFDSPSSFHAGIPSSQQPLGLSSYHAGFFYFVNFHFAHITFISTVNVQTPSSSLPLPPVLSLLPSAAQSSSSVPVPLLPQDAAATSSHLQQFSAVLQLTRDLQQRKPRHLKRPQLSLGEAGTPTKSLVPIAVHKQKLTKCNDSLKLYGHYINQLLTAQAIELNKFF